MFVLGKAEINVMIGNFGLGAGMTTLMVSSTVLIQHIVPDHIRGRIMSIFQLNMAFAQLMTMPVALVGQWLGLGIVLAYLTLAVVVIVLLTQPQIMRAKVIQSESA